MKTSENCTELKFFCFVKLETFYFDEKISGIELTLIFSSLFFTRLLIASIIMSFRFLPPDLKSVNLRINSEFTGVHKFLRLRRSPIIEWQSCWNPVVVRENLQ